jgi:hypothetical protein
MKAKAAHAAMGAPAVSRSTTATTSAGRQTTRPASRIPNRIIDFTPHVRIVLVRRHCEPALPPHPAGARLRTRLRTPGSGAVLLLAGYIRVMSIERGD